MTLVPLTLYPDLLLCIKNLVKGAYDAAAFFFFFLPLDSSFYIYLCCMRGEMNLSVPGDRVVQDSSGFDDGTIWF